MKNQLIRWGLKAWIGLAALATFAGSFILLGRAIPAVNNSTTPTVQNPAPLPTLAPLPSQSTNRTFQRLPTPSSSQPSISPRLRTRGS